MGLDHGLRTITVTTNLDPAPATQQGFDDILLLVDLASNPLSDQVTTYTSYPEAVTAQAAGDISAGTLAILQVMFSQAPRISRIKVGTVDTAGGDGWDDGYAASVAADPDFYGVCMASRTASEVVAVSAAIEAEGLRRLFAQSSDADWLTSGVPSAYSSIVDNERTAIFFHDTNGQPLAEGYAAAYLVWNPDEQSATSALQVRGVTLPATAVTQAQAAFAVANNANLGGALGMATCFVEDGEAITGRRLYELTSADWLRVRIQEDLANLRVERSAYGLKIPVSTEGSELVLARIRRRGQQGIAAGHFDAFEARLTDTISAADIAANRLRHTAVAQLQGDAIYFEMIHNLSRDPITAEG